MGRPTYATREATKAALDSKLTARDDDQVDRANATAVKLIDELLHWAHLEPIVATRYFDWPTADYSRSWVLHLDNQGLVQLTSITTGGETIPTNQVILRPTNEGPPYTEIELDLDTSAGFGGTTGRQNNIAVNGVWAGAPDVSAPAGTLAAAITDTTGTTVDVSDVSQIGVGTLLRCENERLIVTARTALTTGVTLGGDGLTAQQNDQVLEANTGAVGEVVLVDAERMLILDVAGSTRIVKRAWDGSTLAAHSVGATVFAYRRLTVERGACGTTAATHGNGTALTRWVPPALCSSLGVAEAQCQVLNEQSAYGRTVGAGDNEREAAGKTLRMLREQALSAHGRPARLGVV